MKLPVHVQKRSDGVRAYCPELPGCSAFGRTEEEALRRLRVRIDGCFTTATRLPDTRIVHIEV